MPRAVFTRDRDETVRMRRRSDHDANPGRLAPVPLHLDELNPSVRPHHAKIRLVPSPAAEMQALGLVPSRNDLAVRFERGKIRSIVGFELRAICRRRRSAPSDNRAIDRDSAVAAALEPLRVAAPCTLNVRRIFRARSHA